MVNTICCTWSNCLLIMNSYSLRNMWNNLSKKSTSCWFFIMQVAPTYFGVISILRELTAMLLKGTTITQFYNNHAYKMCRFYLKFTVPKCTDKNKCIICSRLQIVCFLIGSFFQKIRLLSYMNSILSCNYKKYSLVTNKLKNPRN